MEHASFAGGLIGRASSACRRTGRSSVQRLQADWPVWPAALTRGLVGRKYRRACRWTGQSSAPALAGGLVWRPSSAAGGLVSRACIAFGGLACRACIACRRTGRSCVHRLQADWSIVRACSASSVQAYRRTGRSSVQRLHADWSVESAATLAGGLASPAYRRLQAGWSGDRPVLQADLSVVRASLAAAWPVVRAALAGGLVDRSCSACRRTGRWSVQRVQADWPV